MGCTCGTWLLSCLPEIDLDTGSSGWAQCNNQCVSAHAAQCNIKCVCLHMQHSYTPINDHPTHLLPLHEPLGWRQSASWHNISLAYCGCRQVLIVWRRQGGAEWPEARAAITQLRSAQAVSKRRLPSLLCACKCQHLYAWQLVEHCNGAYILLLRLVACVACSYLISSVSCTACSCAISH